MPTYKSSVSIEATPDEVFDYVADIRHLPEYFAEVEDAESLGEGRFRITTRARHVREGWMRLHEGRHQRIEWGSTGVEEYSGSLRVDREGQVASVTAQIHTPHPVEGGDAVLDQTLFALKSCIERSASSSS